MIKQFTGIKWTNVSEIYYSFWWWDLIYKQFLNAILVFIYVSIILWDLSVFSLLINKYIICWLVKPHCSLCVSYRTDRQRLSFLNGILIQIKEVSSFSPPLWKEELPLLCWVLFFSQMLLSQLCTAHCIICEGYEKLFPTKAFRR